MTTYSHCPVCGAPLVNYDEVGARKHIARCEAMMKRRLVRPGKSPGRAAEHEPIQSGKREGRR